METWMKMEMNGFSRAGKIIREWVYFFRGKFRSPKVSKLLPLLLLLSYPSQAWH
jgi:hypothetical protein